MSKSDNSKDISTISDRAEAVIADLDRAISEILDASEQSARALQHIGNINNLGADDTIDLLAQISDANQRVVAACSVQDVVRQHLEILIRNIGKEDRPSRENSENEKLLAGPQLDGQVLGQQDIDELLE